jgi:3-oxoacyl-ACP reductase-like protein
MFDKVLSALGFGSAKAAAPAPAAPAPASTPAAAAPAAPAPAPQAAPPPPKPIDVVDVVAQLEERAAKNPEKLNWRTSIVDLLKLLDIDSSFAARKELAHELGIPADLMADSAKMNIWLHKTVLARIAANGGNVPADLLD